MQCDWGVNHEYLGDFDTDFPWVGRRGLVYFEFAIELEASTIGEVYDKAIKINKSVDDRIAHAIEKGINCIRFVLEGAFQIKLPPNVFPGIKKDNNSKV